MPSKFYDVVVIGRSLGALTAAALLARRDFTVLVIGHGRPGLEYVAVNRTLRRRATPMLAGGSPVWGRVIRELALTQTWRRQATLVDPGLQVIAPRTSGRPPMQLDFAHEPARFARDVEREFPEVRRPIADLNADFARVTAAADSCLETEAVWPPDTFFERRAVRKAVARLPYASAEPHADLLHAFPRDHAYRRIVADSVRFATDLATPPPAVAVARLHGAWTRGVWSLEGGEREVEDLLLERIAANGGEIALGERVSGLELRRGAISGVTLDGDGRAVGAAFVVTDLTGEAIANISGGKGLTKRAQNEWPRILPSNARFVVSIVARGDGWPAALGRDVLLLGNPTEQGLAGQSIHLQRCPTGSPGGEELLVAELLLDDRIARQTDRIRQHVLDRVCALAPFLRDHLVLVDSVHDGLPVWVMDGGALRHIDRNEARLPTRAEAMERQFEVDPVGFLGLGGEPVRGPIERSLLCGPSVLPGLGQEGRLLAASSAVRLVVKQDRRKTRVRREMWTKMEIE